MGYANDLKLQMEKIGKDSKNRSIKMGKNGHCNILNWQQKRHCGEETERPRNNKPQQEPVSGAATPVIISSHI